MTTTTLERTVPLVDLKAQYERLERWNAARRSLASEYDRALRGIAGLRPPGRPRSGGGDRQHAQRQRRHPDRESLQGVAPHGMYKNHRVLVVAPAFVVILEATQGGEKGRSSKRWR